MTGRTVRIGLTGPIGCGKSTIAGWLGELGAVVVDADVVAREVLEPGEPALERVLERFGPDVRRPDGSLDRAALGRIVFADEAALRDLESVVHPAVRPRILARIEVAERDRAPAVVIEAIKLVEGGLAALCDEVWLVTCGADAQTERLAGRGMAADEARRRVEAQRRLESRARPLATRVIDTSGSVGETRVVVEAAWVAAIGGDTGQSPARDT
jgi:dephospho-CoA kinase